MRLCMSELHNMGVDGGREKRKPVHVISGANRLPCIGLNPTRSASFDSIGCKANYLRCILAFHWLLRKV